MGVILLTGICHAEDTSLREFQLPKNGTLQLNAPRSWRESVRQPSEDLPPTIIFSPPQGNGFQILITPMWAVRPGIAMPGKEEIRRVVANAAETAKRQAVERDIPIVEIRGDSTNGYYFSATDRAPKPGEFKYMAQGMLRLGELSATFTVLSNDSAGSVVADALKMLKAARHVPAKSPL